MIENQIVFVYHSSDGVTPTPFWTERGLKSPFQAEPLVPTLSRFDRISAS